MIVVDSSSLVAIAERESDWLTHLECLRNSTGAVISGANYVETAMVLTSRGVFREPNAFDEWLALLEVSVDEVTPLSAIAFRAFLSFGRGRHPARLNLGDCFSYGLAKALDAPLLFKGNDFSRTDIRSALQPT